MSYILRILGRELITDFQAFLAERLFQPSSSDDLAFLERQILSEPKSFELHLTLGMLHVRELSFGKSLEHFGKALEIEPDSEQARLGQVLAYLRLADDDRAIQCFHDTLTQHGPDPQICFGLAFCHERAGDVNAAINHYQKVLQIDPAYCPARYRLAAPLLRMNQLEKVIEQYEAIRSEDPGSVFVLVCLGSLYLGVDEPAMAVDMFQRALLIEPDNWQASDEMADSLAQSGLYGEAIEHVAGEIAKHPECAELHLRIAGLYAQAGKDQRALEHFGEALRIHPSFLEACVRCGAHHIRQRRFLEAAKYFARAVEINDNLLVAYVGLGISQARLGKGVQANGSFDMAGSIDPNTTLLFAEMSRLQLKHVLDSYQSGLAVEGQLPFVENSLGQEGVEHSDNALLDQQIEAHGQLLRDHTNYADLHYRYGLLLQARDRCGQAVEQFRQALGINPFYIKAQIKWALVLRREENFAQANKLLDRTVEIDSESIELHYRLGLMYSDHGKFSLAIERYQTDLNEFGEQVDMPANISLALQNMYLIDPVSVSFNAMAQVTAKLKPTLVDQLSH